MSGPQARALAHIVTEHGPGIVTREYLASRLWPTHPPSDVRRSLNVAMCSARKMIPYRVSGIRRRGYLVEAEQ